MLESNKARCCASLRVTLNDGNIYTNAAVGLAGTAPGHHPTVAFEFFIDCSNRAAAWATEFSLFRHKPSTR